jgi:hypothetical protein
MITDSHVTVSGKSMNSDGLSWSASDNECSDKLHVRRTPHTVAGGPDRVVTFGHGRLAFSNGSPRNAPRSPLFYARLAGASIPFC